MQIYCISDKKCVDVLQEISRYKNIAFLTLAVPFMFKDETLFDAYYRLCRGDILKLSGKLMTEYMLLGVDGIGLFLNSVGINYTTRGDVMNILLHNLNR